MNAKPRPTPGKPEEDEVEILEVVGLDEETPAAEEVEVEFDDDGGTIHEPPRPAAAAAVDADQRERYLRLYADFENLKKRVERERVEHRLRATESLLGRLLPVLDAQLGVITSAQLRELRIDGEVPRREGWLRLADGHWCTVPEPSDDQLLTALRLYAPTALASLAFGAAAADSRLRH